MEGVDRGLYSSSLDLSLWPHPVVTTRMGGSCTQGGKPGGRSKTQQARSLLRTAAMDCQDHPEPGLPHPIAKLFGDGSSLRAEVPTEKVMAEDAARRIFPKPQAGQPFWQNQKNLRGTGGRFAAQSPASQLPHRVLSRPELRRNPIWIASP